MELSIIDMGNSYIPGVIGQITRLHAEYYYKNWGFDIYFESKVATELSEFFKRYDKDRDGVWLARLDDKIEGSIVIDGIGASEKGAHLRWFIVSDILRGKGIGKRLIHRAINFCREKNYGIVYLWTFKGLDAARHLYESVGFKLIKQQKGTQWGKEVIEQYFELKLC